MKTKMIIILLSITSTLLSTDRFTINKMLGRGINMGNMLEAPSEGAWGVTLDSTYFPLIKSKNFSSIRIPIRWSTEERTQAAPPYTVDDQFLKRVKWAVDQALSNNLLAVINTHHYEELFEDPEGQHDRFLAIWRQVADYFKDYPDSLVFEILNEPNTNLTAQKWNTLLLEVLAIMRESNPKRIVMIGLAEWGGIGALSRLKLPENDTNTILTIHYYYPFIFTHQGAEWVGSSGPWEGTTWNGTYPEKQSVITDFEYVRKFAQEHAIPVYIGEFGAYSKADMVSRARWTSFCARLFEKYGFSWSYWEFCSGFGVYDPEAHTWRDELVDALISNDTSILSMEPHQIAVKDNLLKNSDFSEGKRYWTFGAWSGSEANSSAADSVFHVTITNPGTNIWDIQLTQDNITLQKGNRYTFMFDAWANSERPLAAGVENTEDYAPYAPFPCALLGKQKRTFSYVFIMPQTRTDARAVINFGCDTTGVHIDNVRLGLFDSLAIPIIHKPPPKSKIKDGLNLKPIINKGKCTIRFSLSHAAKMSFTISDLKGRQLWYATVNGNYGTNSVSLPDSIKPSAGIYYLSVSFDGCNGKVKLVVKPWLVLL